MFQDNGGGRGGGGGLNALGRLELVKGAIHDGSLDEARILTYSIQEKTLRYIFSVEQFLHPRNTY